MMPSIKHELREKIAEWRLEADDLDRIIDRYNVLLPASLLPEWTGYLRNFGRIRQDCADAIEDILDKDGQEE